MKEQTDQLYQEYLEEYLDKIFIDKGEHTHIYDSKYSLMNEFRKKHCRKDRTVEKIYGRVYPLVREYEEYNFTDKNGNIIPDDSLYCVVDLSGNYARILRQSDGLWNYVDINGKLVSDKWFTRASEFRCGRAVVSDDCDWIFYAIDTNGNQISKKYESFEDYDRGIARVRIFPKFGRSYSQAIDLSGAEIFDQKIDVGCYDHDALKHRKIVNDSFDYYEHYNVKQILYKTVNLKDYHIKKQRNGYVCSNGNDTFNIKYRPLRIYDKKLTLCIGDEKVYLYDRELNEYQCLGSYQDIEFRDNFIFDNKNKRVYLAYDEKIVDITLYYYRNLRNKYNLEIVEGISFLSQNDFFIKHEEEIRRKAVEAKIRKEQEEIERKKTKEQKEMERLQKEEKERQENIQTYQDEVFKALSQAADNLKKLEQLTGKIERQPFEHIFTRVGDHREIREDIVKSGFLGCVDLRYESFENVKMCGHNFEGQNLPSLNPQLVYKKDLSHCNFNGVYFPVTTDFTGVDIRGSYFTNDGKATTFDINEASLAKGIYDETTLLNGVPLTELIDNKKTHGTK